jgi:hypothetical protein
MPSRQALERLVAAVSEGRDKPAETVKIFWFYTPIPRGCRNFIHFMVFSNATGANCLSMRMGRWILPMVLLKIRAGFFEWGWLGADAREAVSCGA